MLRTLNRFRVSLRRWWRGGDEWYTVSGIYHPDDTDKAETFKVRGARAASRKAEQWEHKWLDGQANIQPK